MLTPEQEREIAELSSRYGTPLRWRREYKAGGQHNAEWIKRTTRRRGEIILAVPRPGNHLLLHTKSTYPEGIYRLPGGGVNPEESVEHAARREAHEELGAEMSPRRFIGVIENVFKLNGEERTYPSYLFGAPELDQPPRVLDESEKISGFKDIVPNELEGVIRSLTTLSPEWQPWGRFRAGPHEMLLEALKSEKR